MGFAKVYDYVAGKKSWGSYGLPREGTRVPERTAGDVAHREVPTCALDEPLADVRERVRAAGRDTCIVVTEQRVVLGRLGRKAIASEGAESVEGGDVAGAEYRPAQHRHRCVARTDAPTEPDQLPGHDSRWPARRTRPPRRARVTKTWEHQSE